MGKNNKRKREPTPPSEDLGDSEYSEEEFSSESEGSPAPIPLRESSDDSDDSQGLAAEVWTYIRAVERSGFVIPGLQRREVGGCFFCFFSLIQLLFWGFGIL